MFFSRFSLYTNLNSKSWLYCYHASMFEFNTELTFLSGTIFPGNRVKSTCGPGAIFFLKGKQEYC